jgi:hypothetical protein
MATIEKGVVGGFAGIVGPVVGSTWKGISVMRSRPPRKRKGEPSPRQLAAQARFLVISNFLRPITSLLLRNFKKNAKGMSGFNKAFSRNLQTAVTGNYPDYSVDYAKAQLSKGSLLNGDAISATSTAAGHLVVKWKDNSGQEDALISDQAFVAVYNEEMKRWITNEKAATRNSGTYTLDVSTFSGKPVHVYLGFMAADGRSVSDSYYVGMVNVL